MNGTLGRGRHHVAGRRHSGKTRPFWKSCRALEATKTVCAIRRRTIRCIGGGGLAEHSGWCSRLLAEPPGNCMSATDGSCKRSASIAKRLPKSGHPVRDSQTSCSGPGHREFDIYLTAAQGESDDVGQTVPHATRSNRWNRRRSSFRTCSSTVRQKPSGALCLVACSRFLQNQLHFATGCREDLAVLFGGLWCASRSKDHAGWFC